MALAQFVLLYLAHSGRVVESVRVVVLVSRGAVDFRKADEGSQ